MLALILTTLILAFLSLLSSFAVLLRTLLPIVLASKANRSRHRGAYGANLRTTSVDPRSSSVASLRTRRTSEGRSDSGAGPWHDTSPSGWASGGTSATGPTRLRSAQRVQVWLAIFDIVSIAFLLAYWIVVATSPRPTSITFPASPFTDGRSAALLIIALCLRPTLLTLVSTVAFSHIRLGRSSYLGKLDWGLWAITTVFVASIGGLAGILFRCTPHEIASKFLTGSLLGINVILLVAGTVTIFGLMSTIYQAKTAFRFSMHANQGYQGMERSGRSSLTTPNGELGSPTKANLEQSKSLHGLSPSLHEVATDRGTFGVRKSDDLPEPINDFNEAPHPVPQAGEVNALMGTVTTTTGGAMSAVVGSAIASSADPYRLAPPSTQKDTISTARSLATGPFHGGSLGPSGRSPLSTMPERDTATQATHPKHRLGSSTSVTSETHALLDVEVEDRRPSQLSGQSELSDGSGLPYHRNNNSRKSLKEVLDGIAKANQGYDVNDWRHSLSQIRIAASEFSDDDAATLSQRSPRPSIQPDEGLRSSGLPPSPLSQDQAMSPDRIRREVEEQVDRMFAEVGLNSFIKDKWRQIVPTGSLPLVRSPNQSGPDPAEGSRGWKRASTFAQIQTAAFSTKPLLLVPATPRLDHNLIPHTYDPNFDGTFSQSARSAQMGEHSGPERTPSQFSHTGIRYVRTDVVDRELKGSSDSNPFSLKSSMQHCLPAPSRLGTFGEENISDLHHAVDFSHDLPAQASAAAESRPQHASPLHDIFASPQRQSQDDCDRSTKLRPPFFDPGYLAPTAHQLGFVNVPASRTLPTMRGSSLSLGHDSIPPSEASTELVQAVQGGGDDMLGAQSALVRIASYATLRAAVQRVEFDLSGEEDRLQRAARTGSKEAVGQRAAAVAKQNYTLHMLKQAQWQEELLSRRETRVAFLRLSGHMIGMWIPFIFSLPYLVFGLAHPRATSAPFALALLLSLSIILGGPLSLVQTMLTHGTGMSFLTSLATNRDPLQSNSSQRGLRRASPPNRYRDVKSSERTLVNPAGNRQRSDDRLDNFAVRIEAAASSGMNDRVRSVPYGREHWTAGDVAGDRVTRPRSALLRGLSLLFDPRPRLEVLPSRTGREVNDSRTRPSDGQSQGGEDRHRSAHQSFEELNLSRGRARERSSNDGPSQQNSGWASTWASTNARSGNGTTQTNTNSFQLDGLSAMLLPRLVPGLSIGPDVRVADDDERTMVEQYQNFYRRYLSDLPDIFNFNSAREAFRDARQSIVNRLSIRQNLEPTTVAWNMRATNLSTTDATYGTDCAPGDDSVHSFTTAADGGETDEQQTAAGDTLGIRTSPTTTHPQTDGLSAIGSVPSVEPTATSDGSKVFEWVPQQSRASPSRLPTGRSSSISVEAGRSFASLQNVTTRSRQGKHRRDAASLPDAKPELLVEALKDVSVLQPPPSRNDPVGDDLSEPITAEENEEQESQPPATASADNSLSLSVGNARGFEDSNRRSLASELGMVSTRKSLGSETGIESIASGRQRKSLSSDFGLLLAALREQKEDSPSSSKRITSDSMSSTIMSEEISLSSPSRINMTPISNSLRMHSSPPHSRSAAANAVADTTSSISIEEEEEEAAAEALTSLAEEVAGAQMAADQSEQRRPSDEEIIQAIRQMDPLTLHRYMHPAMPLETLDEVTEEMTADLTRSLDAIWMRSKRESFMSMRNQAAIGTPVKSGPQDERSFLGLNTPQSVVGRYGWAVIAKKAEQTICETAAITAVTTALNTRSAETGGQNGITIENRSDVSAFDNSVWNSLAVAPLSFTVPNDGVDSQRVRKASEASISTIGFEREAEWIDCPQGAFPKHSTLKSESKTNSKAGKQRSHTQQSDSTIVNRTSFNSSSSSSNRSSTFSSASGVKAAGVPESPWAVITTRGEADLTILSPAPTTHAPSVVEVAEKAASMVTQRISRFENLSAAQETPCKMGSNRSASIGEYNAACASQARNLPELGLNSASMIMVMAAERHRIALQDKTNRPVGSHDAHDIPDVKRSHPSSTRQSLISASSSSPTKRSSYPPAHQDEVAPETNYSQTASLGRKSVRTGGTIPTIHVRGPSDSSALSFYHY
ncbi:unnamed protein product [Tilletia laevis]|uniref:Uncharacterized protein n=2 Tax=Tilletia TaxID=13289 RepID=A0A9N8LHB2_9BASI|nr:unnamed protein product [Tilletia caries]CAD6913073.1 unnamed protein product [Tilletia laevis]CAD6945809.1 unnamed protein product [Tilletia controversa]CAD6924079.1 unnamed protein product [Tilletia caries]CAD6940139.1 unnamed protein product [Tilletia laevis]